MTGSGFKSTLLQRVACNFCIGLTGIVSCVLLTATPTVARSDGPNGNGQVEAITRPSRDGTLSFVQPGEIAKVLVKVGDTVKAGQLLVQLDDAVEQAQLKQLKAEAEDVTRVAAAEAQLAQKKLDLQKVEMAAAGNAATKMEVEHGKLEVLIGELSLNLAKHNLRQANRQYEQTKLQLDRMKMTSPIDGKVEVVFIEEGESVDQLEDVIRVVQIDPLWIDAPVPLEQARALRIGDTAKVIFPGNVEGSGKVVHIASIADAASETLYVRIETPNTTGRPAGEHVRVQFIPSAQKTVAPAATPQPETPTNAADQPSTPKANTPTQSSTSSVIDAPKERTSSNG